jgi:hypothetical protein
MELNKTTQKWVKKKSVEGIVIKKGEQIMLLPYDMSLPKNIIKDYIDLIKSKYDCEVLNENL